MLISFNVDNTRDAMAELKDKDYPFIGGARKFRNCEFAFVHPKATTGVLLEYIDDKDPLSVRVIHREVIEGVFGFGEEAVAAGCIAYPKSAEQAARDVRAGRGALALYLNALAPEDVFRVTAAGDVLPQKSTFFYPKLPTGLLFRVLAGPNVWDFQFFLTTRSPRDASLAALHGAGYSHGDCKWHNFMIVQDTCYLVDLERARRGAGERGRARDVGRFAVAAEEYGLIACLILLILFAVIVQFARLGEPSHLKKVTPPPPQAFREFPEIEQSVKVGVEEWQ